VLAASALTSLTPAALFAAKPKSAPGQRVKLACVGTGNRGAARNPHG
jgi:hypothetical protein